MIITTAATIKVQKIGERATQRPVEPIENNVKKRISSSELKSDVCG